MSEIWNEIKSKVERYQRENPPANSEERYFQDEKLEAEVRVRDERGVEGHPIMVEGKFAGIEYFIPKDMLNPKEVKKILELSQKEEIETIRYETTIHKYWGKRKNISKISIYRRGNFPLESLEIENIGPVMAKSCDEFGAKFLDKILKHLGYRGTQKAV